MKNIIARCALLAATVFTLSGCISFNHQELAKSKDARPAVLLNLNSTPDGSGTETSSLAAASVQSVIVYQGPGSWKREAYWDEYVVAITNHGTEPLVIETATLADFQGNSNPPYADVWKLEKESLTSWQKLKSSQRGTELVLGAGAAGTSAFASPATGGIPAHGTTASAALAGAGAAVGLVAPIYAGTATIASIATGGFWGPAAAAAGAAPIALAAAPIYLATVMVINSNNKAKVLAEFARRRLSLPLTLAPGATASGSFFFRLSPSPTRLTLGGRTENKPSELIVDLAPLSGLHLKPATPVPATQATLSSHP